MYRILLFCQEELYREKYGDDPGIYRCPAKGMDYVQEHSAEEIAKCIAPQFAETGSDTLTAIVARYQEQDTWKKI